MSKRARYTGGEPVRVTYPPGAVVPEKEWIVEPGKWLPDDVPASVRDELIANHQDFAEVQQQTDSKSTGEKSATSDSEGKK